MQPYFYPYMGYFDLIKSVDVFVFLNDVQYTRGWMNRNKVEYHGSQKYIRVPVKKHSQKTNINCIEIFQESNWFDELEVFLNHCYGNISNHCIIQNLKDNHKHKYLDELLIPTIIHTARLLGINTEFMMSDELTLVDYDGDLPNRYHKILQICKLLNAKDYMNAYGGKELYQSEIFNDHGIQLSFMPKPNYSNMCSILDVILKNETKTRI